jgi:HEAT repeat protein
MSRTKFALLVLAVLCVAVGLAVAFDPAARLQGWVRSEPFYRDRSATAWQRDLANPDENTAVAATGKLAEGKGQSVAVCAWLLAHAEESQVRYRAMEALGKMGQDAAPASKELVLALGDADPLVRAAAVRTIAALAPDVPGAVPGLMKLFPEVEAIQAVARFKQGGAEAVPRLIELTKHENAVVRRQAVRTLGKIGQPALPALPAFIGLIESDAVPGVREQSAEAIGEIGPSAAEGIPTLVKALKDPDAMVRRDAVRSLGQMGPLAKSALPEVLPLTKDPEPKVRDAAARAARLIDPAGKK